MAPTALQCVWVHPKIGGTFCAADNQSPTKQDNRDHWTLFPGNLPHLFQVVQIPPTTLYFPDEEVKAEMTIHRSKKKTGLLLRENFDAVIEINGRLAKFYREYP